MPSLPPRTPAQRVRPGEYAWVAAGWPELARYLEEKGFGAAA